MNKSDNKQKGAAIVEYLPLIAGAAAMLIGAANYLGSQIEENFETTTEAIEVEEEEETIIEYICPWL